MKNKKIKSITSLLVGLAVIWAAVIVVISGVSILWKFFTDPSLGKALFVLAVICGCKVIANNRKEESN